MDSKSKWALAIVGIVLLAVVVYLLVKPAREGYSNIGDLSHIGAVETPAYAGSYEPVAAPEMDVPAEVFAGMVDSGAILQDGPAEAPRPIQRLERVQGSDLLPLNSAMAVPYNIDIADPLVHSYSVNAPRVILKNPRWENSLFMSINGDIPLKYYPNIPLVGKSRYDRDSWQGSGVFSDYYKSMYNRFTGKERLNMPMYVANGETIMS